MSAETSHRRLFHADARWNVRTLFHTTIQNQCCPAIASEKRVELFSMASRQDPIAEPLRPHSLGTVTQNEVLRSYFGTNHQRPAGYFSDFMAYYTEEPGKLQTGLIQSQLPIIDLDAKTHRDILDITTILRENRGQKRPVIRQILNDHQQQQDDRSLDHLCDLAVRMWLMINVLAPEVELVVETPRKPWIEGKSLDDLIQSLFPQSKTVLGLKESRLDPHFTAINLKRICGLRLEWTECLANHLRLDRRKKVLWVFPFKAFLQGHLDYESEEGSK